MILMVVLQNYHTLFSPPIYTQSCLVQNGAAPVRKEWHSFFGKSLSPYLILWIGHKNTAFGSTYLPLGESVNISLIVPLLEGFGSSFSMPSTSWLHCQPCLQLVGCISFWHRVGSIYSSTIHLSSGQNTFVVRIICYFLEGLEWKKCKSLPGK